MSYKHTQSGYVMWGFLGISILVCGILALVGVARPLLITLTVGLAWLLFLFYNQTVEINAQSLRFWFGPGLIRKRIPLTRIASCQPVRNHWFHGWGIHHYGRGWLYNVSGLQAVEIELDSGKQLRIGTDEPDMMSRAITQAKAGV